MIKNKKLLIDADCPMCRLYGRSFEKLKLIDEQTVQPYQNSAADYCWAVDLERAKSEIAFIDIKTRETIYGIDAFTEIISQDKPGLKKFLNFSPVRWLSMKLYRFISFNRKVIASSNSAHHGLNCEPQVHKGYRWSYIILSAIFTGFVLSIFGNRLSSAIGIHYYPFLEYGICMGQIIWQGGIVKSTYPDKLLEYLGNMSTISLMGAILLIPAILIHNIFNLGALYLIISFGLVVCIMFQTHLARCNKMGISKRITFSWIGYRALVLASLIFISL